MCVPGGTLIFVPSIQGYLSDRGTLDKQEVLLGDAVSSSFCFSFWKKGGLVLEGGSSLPSLCQVSFVRMSPPLACLPLGRIGWSSWGGDSKTWLKEV